MKRVSFIQGTLFYSFKIEPNIRIKEQQPENGRTLRS